MGAQPSRRPGDARATRHGGALVARATACSLREISVFLVSSRTRDVGIRLRRRPRPRWRHRRERCGGPSMPCHPPAVTTNGALSELSDSRRRVSRHAGAQFIAFVSRGQGGELHELQRRVGAFSARATPCSRRGPSAALAAEAVSPRWGPRGQEARLSGDSQRRVRSLIEPSCRAERPPSRRRGRAVVGAIVGMYGVAAVWASGDDNGGDRGQSSRRERTGRWWWRHESRGLLRRESNNVLADRAFRSPRRRPSPGDYFGALGCRTARPKLWCAPVRRCDDALVGTGRHRVAVGRASLKKPSEPREPSLRRSLSNPSNVRLGRSPGAKSSR